VLLNLLGPVVLHPYADRDELCFLTREAPVTSIYNGVVYEEQAGGFRHALVENQTAAEGILRTSIPLSLIRGRRYVCKHTWLGNREPFDISNRDLLVVGVPHEDILVVTWDRNHQIVLDLGLELELKTNETTLWDHVTD
jgi:hypothetical protein